MSISESDIARGLQRGLDRVANRGKKTTEPLDKGFIKSPWHLKNERFYHQLCASSVYNSFSFYTINPNRGEK